MFRRIGLFALMTAVLVGAGVAWTQARQQPAAPADPAPPRPETVDLPAGRLDRTALVRARQDPLSGRLRTVLRQNRQMADLLSDIDASAVPVLGPPDPALLASARFYPGDRQYTLVIRRPGQIVEIFGSTRALRSPTGAGLSIASSSAPPARTFARADATRQDLSQIIAEQTEYGVDVAFLRFGAAYNLTFICDAMGPPDCTEAAAVTYAASLQLLGGGEP